MTMTMTMSVKMAVAGVHLRRVDQWWNANKPGHELGPMKNEYYSGEFDKDTNNDQTMRKVIS
jgi:hypothetical protein